jgi:glycosyltransferase involved in cell wall biosynthesis
MKVAIYHSSIIKIGGIETFLYNFCQRMSKHFDITLYFDNADFEQLIKYSEFVDCVKVENEIKADVIILASAWGKKPKLTAPKIIQTIHANLKNYKDLKIFEYVPNKDYIHVCVSKSVAKALKELHGIDSTVIYNLTSKVETYLKPVNEKLTLITACRLSQEKGIERCIKFAKQIPVPYVWNMYCDTPSTAYKSQIIEMSKGTNMIWHGFKTPILPEIAKADYLLQLSDTEGYCYSIVEALQVKTPVIVTPFESAFEQVEHKKNGYIVDFDLKSINFDEIINQIPIVKPYKDLSTESDWIKIIKP